MNSRPIDQPAECPSDCVGLKDYEAPCIETVLTPEELAHEVLYAGAISRDGSAD